MDIFNIKAKSKEDAIKLAEEHFNTSRNNIELTVLKDAKKIFGAIVSLYEFEAKFVEPKVVESIDGSFTIEYTKEGVILNVQYPKGNGELINFSIIEAKCLAKKINSVDIDAIKKALRNRETKVKIAEAQDEILVDEIAYAHGSDDNLLGYITFLPPEGGKLLSEDEILKIISSANITYGIDEQSIKNCIKNKQYNVDILIARGIEPTNGENGSIKLNFDFDTSLKPKSNEKGKVDYFNLDNYTSVKEGQVLATYILPTNGIDGMDIYGRKIKCIDGKNIKLPIGKNVGLLEDGITIVSKVDGLLEFYNNIISVNKVLYIEGDVDLSTGNVKFIGNVKINGNIKSRMTVEAEGSVEVNGVVESATVIASGDIILKSGIQGMGKGELRSEGNITAKFIENAIVYAKNSVKAGSIIHSDVESGDFIEITGLRGSIIGGNIKAKNSITSRNIGSISNVVTNIKVGILPSYRKSYTDLEQNIAKIRSEIDKLEKATSISDDSLNESQKLIKSRLLKESASKTLVLSEYVKELNILRESIEINENSFISVIDNIYPGVKITINNSNFNVDEIFKHSTFKIVDGEIAAITFKAK